MVLSAIKSLLEGGKTPTRDEVAARLVRSDPRGPQSARAEAMLQIAVAIRRGEVEIDKREDDGRCVLRICKDYSAGLASVSGEDGDVVGRTGFSRTSSMESHKCSSSSSSGSSLATGGRSLTALLNPPTAKRPAYLDARLPTPPYSKIQRKLRQEEEMKRHSLEVIELDDAEDVRRETTTTQKNTTSRGKERIKPEEENEKRRENTSSDDEDDDYETANASPPLDLSPEAKRILELVREGKSIFYTGAAGTGKSYLLREIIRQETKRRSSANNNQVFVTAPTGMAACVVGGTTINSFGGIGLGKEDAETLARRVSDNPNALKRWRTCGLLIVDEVSMMDAVLFEKLERIARILRNSTLPFGGIQLCLVGDFFQLPPVGSLNYCFRSPMWSKVVRETVVLTKIYRQTDERLVKFLNEVRVGKVSLEGRELIRERSTDLNNRALASSSSSSSSATLKTVMMNGGSVVAKVEPTRLFAKNLDVDSINQSRLVGLNEKIHTHRAVDTNRTKNRFAFENFLESCPAPAELKLCVGAQVVLLKNLSNEGLVNGSRGVVIGFERVSSSSSSSSIVTVTSGNASNEYLAMVDAGELLPVVLFHSHPTRPRLVTRAEWEFSDISSNDQNGKQFKRGGRIQIPLKLSWAITIHKSQGMTLDLVHVDLSGVFEHSQAYVALSRASSLAGLTISGYVHGKSIFCHPDVVRFYEEVERKATHARRECRDDDDDEDDFGVNVVDVENVAIGKKRPVADVARSKAVEKRVKTLGDHIPWLQAGGRRTGEEDDGDHW